METYDISAAVEAQKEYCKEYAANHPDDWASKMMSKGEGFAPIHGVCWCCHQNIYAEQGYRVIGRRRTNEIVNGISVERARHELTTGCPFCYRSYVD